MSVKGDHCSRTQERIELYLDGELAGSDREEFEQHVGECPSCREELALAETVTTELRSLPRLDCPDRAVNRAEVVAGAGTFVPEETWLDRLRRRMGGRLVWLPRPAMTVMLVVLFAATVFVLSRHEQSPFNGRTKGLTPAETLTEKEVELAKLDVMIAFAYIGKYSKRTGQIVKKDVLADRVVKPLGKTVVDPMYPFPRDE
jgi:hypothetical protein